MTADIPRGTNAAEYATLSVPIAAPDETVAEVWQGLRGSRLDSADDLAVCDGTESSGW